MTQQTPNFPTSDPTWDLESIFAGGAESKAFFAAVEDLNARIRALREQAEALVSPASEAFDQNARDAWAELLGSLDEFQKDLRDCGVFAHGMGSSHADDPKALRLSSSLNDIAMHRGSLGVTLKMLLKGISDEAFEGLRGEEKLSHADLMLRELRRDADLAMDTDLEMLAVELNRDGLNAWSELYSNFTGALKVELVDESGAPKTLSVGQAKSLLEHPEREMRRRAFEGLQKTWADAAPVCAAALNSIIGAEQILYRRRGTNELTHSLNANRVTAKTVQAMNEAARRFQPDLHEYMALKAKALGVEKLEWYDLHAPLTSGEEKPVSYEEAQRFIFDNVEEFSSDIAAFCKHALVSQWVEVENRPGKAQGGYCATLPGKGEVRIFMTFGGTASGVKTLAHELGHGYHAWVMRDMPASQRRVPMGLAETASTLLEALVEEAALKKASGDEKLKLLDERLGRAMAFLMDIPARYNLEVALHQKRAQGPLNEDVLKEITREAFRAEFGDAVASIDELFWASKPHFYFTYLPFYNFPYTFGYLFSRAVYERAQKVGPDFLPVIDELLRDTGRITSEEVAAKYLDGDLENPDFWYEAAGSIKADVAEFRRLVEG